MNAAKPAVTRILILGNSSSGKSTLAKKLSRSSDIAHLDLDTLAWNPSSPPERLPIETSATQIHEFIDLNTNWVIEGCYTDLLEIAAPHSSEVIFMNLPIDTCIENAKRRPWEPHKYPSKQAQDANLEMLIEWISQYPNRNDTFSLASHQSLYEQHVGDKRMVTGNE